MTHLLHFLKMYQVYKILNDNLLNVKKKKLVEKLREEAGELRGWMSDHSSPDTPASEFCEIANRYAIICTKIYIIDKQW